MGIQPIKLSLIEKEKDVRDKKLDMSLLKSLEQGYDETYPLIVEENQVTGKFALIEGYRRINALLLLVDNPEEYEVPCLILRETNVTNRFIKRLKNERLTKRKTAYERGRLVKELVGLGVSAEEIARLTNYNLRTIKKDIEQMGIDEKILKDGEKKSIGRDGLFRISKLQKIKMKIKETLIYKLTNKKIYAYHVNSIEKLDKIKGFEKLGERAQERCIEKAIDLTRFEENNAEIVVAQEILKKEHIEEIHKIVYDKTLSDIKEIVSNFHQNFSKNLSEQQRQEIREALKPINLRIGVVLQWQQFPNSTKVKETK